MINTDLDFIRNRLAEYYRIRNLSPNAAFGDLQVIDAMAEDVNKMLDDLIETRRKLQVAVARAVSHANLLSEEVKA